MRFGFRLPRLRTWKARVAVVLVVALIGSAAGIYAYLRARPTAAPVAKVGLRTVAKSKQAEYLTLVATTPPSESQGVPVNTPITMSFNLPVDAAGMQSYFSVLPDTPGSFGQGSTAQDVVFKPSQNFPAGASVNVVLRAGLASRDNFALKDAYSFRFLTQVASRNVAFQTQGQDARLVNIGSKQSVGVTVQTGDQVPSDIALQTFQATSSDLVADFVHSSTSQYADKVIGTASMHLVDTKSPVTNGQTVTITEPDGIYLLLAADNQGQYGALWLDFSKYGVLLRQDDQKIVVAGEDLTTGDTTPTFQVTFYGLQDRVQTLQSGSFSGTGEFQTHYPSGIDLAVASTGGEDVVIPVLAPETDADVKVVTDLTMKPQIYLTTDRAGYQKGDTVKFGGVMRFSNDQAYQLSATTVGIWLGSDQSPIAQASLMPDGTFSGSFPMPDTSFNADGSANSVFLYADTVSGQHRFVSPFTTTIQALGAQASAGQVVVTFDKASYVASDTIVVSIASSTSAGAPMANQPLSLTVYSNQHRVRPIELDSFPGPTAWGDPVQQNVAVHLDGNGHASYSFSANVAQKTADQEVTVALTNGGSPALILGARTEIVYQAADEIFLLTSRSTYQPGETLRAPFVAETRGGDRLSNLPVAYEIDKTDYQGSNAITTVVASGSLTTDQSGLGTVSATYSGPTGAVVLRVKAKDAAGNAFGDVTSLTVTSDPTALVSFGATDRLSQLDVTTDKIAYSVGDSAHLTITSPVAQSVALSLERGRIHKYQWIQLQQGDNSLTLPISSDLAPGFTVVFSYFKNGAYVSEGEPIFINNQAQRLKLSVTPDRPNYTAGQTAHLAITVTDSSGAPVSAALLLDGYNASMSADKLFDQASLAAVFLTPDARATNGSSSLLGIGGWGGRCGGGMNQNLAVTNPGPAVAWLPGLATDSAGHLTVDVPVASATVRVALFASTSSSAWGQAETDLTVQ